MFTIDRVNRLLRHYDMPEIRAIDIMTNPGWVRGPTHKLIDKLDELTEFYTRCTCRGWTPKEPCTDIFVGARLALHEEHAALPPPGSALPEKSDRCAGGCRCQHIADAY